VTPARPTAGIVLVLVSTIAFAIGPTAVKLAFENGSNTLTVVTLRGFIGAGLMALLIALTRQRFAIDRRAWRWCLWGGAFYAVMVYALMGSLATIPVNVAVLIFFAHPIVIAVIAHWRGGDRLTPAKLLLAGVALAGLGLVLGPGFEALDPTGIALAALAALTISGMILCCARAHAFATSTQVNFWLTALTGVAFLAVITAADDWAWPTNRVGWFGVAGAGLGIGVGFLTFFAAMRHLSPVRATMLSNVEPLLSILFAAAILGERLEPLRWLGVVVVIGALVLFEAAGRPRAT
jgi:drug/metabolite transporter (DMT)-like permease